MSRGNVNPGVANYAVLEPRLVRLIMGSAVSALALVYFSRWGIRLARPCAWPFFWLRRGALNLMVRIRARVALGAAIRHHRERNRRLVGREGRLAVCRDHLTRFKSQTAKLAYGRPHYRTLL